MIEAIPKTDKISNNLGNLNFCLDDNYLAFDNIEATFVNVFFTITTTEESYDLESLYALKKGRFSFNPGEMLQAYATLSDSQIDSYFNNLELDVAPIKVKIKIKFLNAGYEVLSTFDLPELKFHAGQSSIVPADGSVVERSLNYNSVLALAYRYDAQFVKFQFQGKEEILDKQKESAPDNIYQLLFKQSVGREMIPKSFSDGFSDGFAIGNKTNTNGFYDYQEAFIHNIKSSYDVKAINFPLAIKAYNVVWLDDNNIFHSMTFSGNKIKSSKLEHLINVYAKNFRERKAGTIKQTTLKLNLGWSLFSEIPMLNSLAKSKIAWFFEDDINKRVEAFCTSESLEEENTTNELTEDFVLEFRINE